MYCALPAERCCMSAEVLFLCTEQNGGFRMEMVVGRCLGVCHVTQQIQVKQKKKKRSMICQLLDLASNCSFSALMELTCPWLASFRQRCPLLECLDKRGEKEKYINGQKEASGK